jgi:hypothetical protein
MINHIADELLFKKDKEQVVFRSMVVSDKVLDNDHIQENKV